MSTTSSTAESDYLLLFRGKDWDNGLSPDELQRAMNKVMGWFEGLQKQGRVRGGQPLAREGRTISGKNALVADGPFAESKEAVGGYLMLQAANLEDAISVARTNPTLEYGVTIEVRPVLEECPIFQRANKKVNFATA